MRILLLAARYLPHRGGLETVVHQLSTHLISDGHTVLIVTNRYPRILPRTEMIDGVPVERLLFVLPEWSYLRNGQVGLWLASIVLFPITLLQLYLLVRRMRPDVVNVHYLGIPAFFVWLVHQAVPFRLVVSLHGGDVDAEPYRSRFRRWLFEAVTTRADQVTACSRALLRQAITLVPEIEDKGIVIHNGVDTRLFDRAEAYPHPRRYVVAVGQLVHHKGFDVLLTAFSQLRDRFPDVDLLVAGDGPERFTLLAQSETLNLNVVWLGRVDAATVASLMCGSAAIAIPSRREPFGIVGLEAMAAGRPIVASRIDGLEEALEDAHVHWCAPNDARELARCLADALQTSSARQIADNRYHARHREWSTVVSQYFHTYSISETPTAALHSSPQ